MKATTLSFLTLLFTLPAFAQSPPVPATQPGPQQAVTTPALAPSAPAVMPDSPIPPDNSRIVIPAQTTIPLILASTINTRSAYVGQAIYCESIFPITVQNHIVIPKGSSIRGTITQVIRPGHVKGKAQIGMRFDELILPNGTTVQLRASLSGFGSAGNDKLSPKESKIEGQSSKGADAGKVARTTVPAAEIGTIVGASKGSTLEGLGIGSAVGAAGGLIWVLASRGKDVILPHGTSLELQLSVPITFSRYEVERPTRYDGGPELPRREYGPGA